MNRNELVSVVSEKCGMSKKDTEKTLLAIIETIVDSVKNDEKVQLLGFGTFEMRRRNERIGRDPRTKEEINIPACNVPVFKAGKGFKDTVAGR